MYFCIQSIIMKKILFTYIFLFLTSFINAQKPFVTPVGFDTPVDSFFIVAHPAMSKNYSESFSQPKGKLFFGQHLEINSVFVNIAQKTLSDSGTFYSAEFYSQGAYSIGFTLSDFHLNDGNELYFYSHDKKYGSDIYTDADNNSDSSFTVFQIPGDTIVALLFVPFDSQIPDFTIKTLIYDFADLFKSLSKSSQSGDCETDINCSEGDNYQILKHSVVQYSFQEGVYQYMCSGVLVNNSRLDGTPYVLTAAHCVCNQKEATSATFLFNYELSECGTTSVADYQQINGASLLATGPLKTVYSYTTIGGKKDSTANYYPILDFTLLKLSSDLSILQKPYFAGWSIDTQTNLDSVVCIHHPMGDYKKISTCNIPPYCDTYPGADAYYNAKSHWHIDQWAVGTTEQGSSGAPLFNTKNQVIGTLSGGYATCDNSVDDYFNMFSKAWDTYDANANQLKYWLCPDNDISSLDGLDFYGLLSDLPVSDVSAKWVDDTKTSAAVSWTFNDKSVVKQDFETTDNLVDVGFTATDKDYKTTAVSDLIDFENEGKTSSWILADSTISADYSGYKSNKSVACFTVGQDANNDYLILPKTEIKSGYVLYFYAKSVGGISSINLCQNTLPTQYVTIANIDVPQEWTLYRYPLDDYSSTSIYINFDCVTTAGSSVALLLDDISIRPDTANVVQPQLSGYQLFCNGDIIYQTSDLSDTLFTYDNITKDGIYSFYVYNTFADGKISFAGKSVSLQKGENSIGTIDNPESSILFPNPSDGHISLISAYDYNNVVVELVSLSGKLLYSHKNVNIAKGEAREFDFSCLPSGLYILRILTTDKSEFFKISLIK